jgi:hypothetical protein
MPDTGPPWNIPYVDDSDLVRDFPTADEAQALAVAAGLTSAGGLVEVKSVLFDGTQSASTAAGANFAVTNLTIDHTLADAANKIIFLAYFGVAANSDGKGQIGIGIADGGTLIGVGASPGSRVAVGAGGQVAANGTTSTVSMPSIHLVYAPGDAVQHTYTVRAIQIRAATDTLYINRTQADTNTNAFPRGVSGFTLMEIKV